MKKSDLKSGMMVVNRIGDTGIVLRDFKDDKRDIIAADGKYSTRYWGPLDRFHEDLTHKTFKSSDIIKVYDFKDSVCGVSLNPSIRKLIWEREKDVEMTIEEVCKALGKNVKIVITK